MKTPQSIFKMEERKQVFRKVKSIVNPNKDLEEDLDSLKEKSLKEDHFSFRKQSAPPLIIISSPKTPAVGKSEGNVS